MTSLIVASIFFLAIHLGIAGSRLRDRIIGSTGPKIYRASFSIASVIGLVWLISAYVRAPYLSTWGMLEWWKPVAIVLMLPAVLFVVIGLATPDPTAVGQESMVSQPPRGIVRITRHPFLIGVALWAIVHLIGNGDLASLVFFGTLAIVALAGTASIDAKRRRLMGPAWTPFAAQTTVIPLSNGVSGLGRVMHEIGAWRLVAAIVVYVILLGAHGPVIGISPFPS